MSATVLTLDLGTSATKAALWAGGVRRALHRAPLATAHPGPDRVEQEPGAWWDSVVDSCARVRDAVGDHTWAGIDAVGFSAARSTFALVDDELAPIGPGIVWSDARATDQLDHFGDPSRIHDRTGMHLTAGCAAAKVAWVAAHEPDRFARARWVLAPRDLVVARLTGVVVTEPTLESRTGWTALDGELLADDALRHRLPRTVASTARLDPASDDRWWAALALPRRAVVVPGAGDRACEVLGTGATATCPMVSWGTTANVSLPYAGPASAFPPVAQVSRAPDAGFLLEAGLAAAGSAVGWLARLTGRSVEDLWRGLAEITPGADGVRALPWFQGARAPWWRADATAAFHGLTPAHTPAHLARAVVEGIALDVQRSLELLGAPGTAITLAGAGAANVTWAAILGGVTSRAVVVRSEPEAASVGALLLTQQALGVPTPLDEVNPVRARRGPVPELVAAYGEVRADADRTAETALRLRDDLTVDPPPGSTR
ncbi:MAG: xylulokinase [Acidimicrobiia bacterium]